MPKEQYIVISTGAKEVKDLQFKVVVHRGKKPILPYEEIIKALNSGKAYVVDLKVKKTTVRSGVATIKKGLNKGWLVKVQEIEGTEHQLAYVPVKEKA